MEVDVALTKIQGRNAAGLNKIPPEVWKTRKFDEILLSLCNAIYKQNTTEKWRKWLHPPFHQERRSQNHKTL